VRAVLEETFTLLAAHLNLFTLISLTVWLPGHILRNYFEFFAPPAVGPIQSLQAMLLIHLMFDPLVVSATVVALGRIKLGLPVGYRTAMLEGLAAWGRLLLTRFVINVGVALPALGALMVAPATGALAVGAGVLFLVVAVLTVTLLLRVAVVDSVVVLERATAFNAWGRAAALTAGQRLPILLTLVLLFAAVLAIALLVAQLFRAMPQLNHFVLRVLLDCALAVSQSLFTIALFLFYWRARAREGAPLPAVLTSR
jgi:hypothetical protein